MFKQNRKKVPPPVPAYQNNNTAPSAPQNTSSQLQFHCQLAHGSPTIFVSDFKNVKELYKRIAAQFGFDPNEILFCTLNTFKPDMSKLLGGQLGLDDFVFVHKKGRPKEVELIKSEEALGLTITDNGNGYAFIKRIKEGSVIDSISHIQVGDHIEKLNGANMIGMKHFEVAKLLKEIKLGDTFTIRLVEPMKSGFNSIAPRKVGGEQKYGSGKETLRFYANGSAKVSVMSDEMDVAVEKINVILDKFMGINDNDLATQIYDKAEGKLNSMDFAEAIDTSNLETFQFDDDLIIEMWGAITDARSGRRN